MASGNRRFGVHQFATLKAGTFQPGFVQAATRPWATLRWSSEVPEREIVVGGVDGGKHVVVPTGPMSTSGARGKIRASTGAMRQLSSDSGAVDRVGDATEGDPVRCLLTIHEAPDAVPERRLPVGWIAL